MCWTVRPAFCAAIADMSKPDQPELIAEERMNVMGQVEIPYSWLR